MLNKLKTIVAVGLYRPGTGFTRVLQSIFDQLKNDFEIHWVGIGYKGAVIDKGYKIYPNNVNGGDMYGAYFSKDLSIQVNADIILLLNDFWMFKNYKHSYDQLPPHIVTMAYVPLDGKISNCHDVSGLDFLDHVVLYTEFAYREAKNALLKLKSLGKVEKTPTLSVINHGVDKTSFYVLNKSDLKNKIFTTLSDKKSIIVLNANRYTERKGIDHTLSGFAKSLKLTNKKVYLCLHMPGIEDFQLEELLEKISALQLMEHVIINPLGRSFVSDKRLNELYNVCDIGINSSFGEGWGLISFEHACAGGCQLVPNHTACTELWKDSGTLIPGKEDIKLAHNPFTMTKIDEDKLSEMLAELYNNKKHLNEKKQNCFNSATHEKYNWLTIAEKWKTLFLNTSTSFIAKEKIA